MLGVLILTLTWILKALYETKHYCLVNLLAKLFQISAMHLTVIESNGPVLRPMRIVCNTSSPFGSQRDE